jgi:O-antigen ligase
MSKTERIFNILLVAFCGLWLLWKQLSGPLLILLIVVAVIGWLRKENTFCFQKMHWLWVVLFGVYALSLFWSAAPDFQALERKLALLAFPLLFAFQWKNPLPLAQMWLSHTLACVVLLAIAYYDAFMCQMHLGNSVRCFSTTYFSQVHHPSYFSAFLIFSIIGLLLGKVAWFAAKPRWISWLLIGVFTAMHLHLGTLAGIIGVVVVFMTYTIWLFSKKFGWLKSILIGYATLSIGIITSLQSQEIKADAQNAFNFTKSYLENPTAFVKGRKEPLQGNEVRLILWTASYQIGKQHPFGLGLGGLEPALSQKLIRWGYPQQAEKEFNPHNQWLQIWNEIGWLGLGVFGFLLSILTLYFYQNRNLAALLLTFVFLIFCLFESILQRESGIVFFLCWLTALSCLTKRTTS